MNKIQVGDRFERLVVVEKSAKGWIVQCDCGSNPKDITTSNIRKIKSCGCYSKENASIRNKTKAEDLTGAIFGKLTVVEQVDKDLCSYHWKVHCGLCNQYKTMTTGAIKRAKSCGCRLNIVRQNTYTYSELVEKAKGYVEIKEEVVRNTGSSNHREFISVCSACKQDKIVGYGVVSRSIKKKISWVCLACSRETKSVSKRTVKKKKSIRNTSGYIGVSLNKAHQLFHVSIMREKTNIGLGSFENSKLGLLKAALERELFIIAHKLPHTRNFTNNFVIKNLHLFDENRKGSLVKLKRTDFVSILQNPTQ